MRAATVAALVVVLALPLGRTARAAGASKVDYDGWQVIVTGIDMTTATYHYSTPNEARNDKCTVVRRGTLREIVVQSGRGSGLDSFDMHKVSQSSSITVSGQGSDVVPGNPTERWAYKSGPSDDYSERANFIVSTGGAPQTSPEEPMFMPRAVIPQSFLSHSCWSITNANSLFAFAREVADKAWAAEQHGDTTPLAFVFPHRLDGQHLTASGHRTFTYDLPGPLETGSCTIEASYNVVVIPAPANHQPPKVALDEIDRGWWPEDNNSLTAHLTVPGAKPAQAFRLTLYDVSKEPGTCCNSPDAGTDPDLSFAPEGGGWTVEAKGDQSVATSNQGGTDAKLKIACHDWGAWGKLKGEAKIDDKWEPAQVAGSGLGYVRIPYDDDDDHIADSWQELYSVGGRSARDDGGKVPLQLNDGDTLSVYDCYRGFMVRGADGAEHQSPDPKRKTLFVLDKSGYFDPDLWRQCSGINAYLLTDGLCQQTGPPEAARLVNMHSSNAKNGDKYCVVVTVVKGQKKDSDGEYPMGVTDDADGNCPKSPRAVVHVFLYPGNMRYLLDSARTQVEAAMAHPDSADAKAIAGFGLPARMWPNADDRLKDEAYLQALTDQTMRQTAIHEMGHACGVPGHVVDKSNPKSKEGFGLGNKSCPMYYMEGAENLRYLILQVLIKPNAPMPFIYGQFCKDPDFNCWGHLNVKDN